MMHLVQSILGTVTGDVEQHVASAKRNAIAYALMVLLGLGAYGFGLAALAIYLAAEYGAIASMLALCALNLGLLAAIVIVQRILQARARRRLAARHRSDGIMLASLGISLLPVLTRSKPLGIVAALGGLAFAAARLTHSSSESGSPDPEKERARLEAELADLERIARRMKPNSHLNEPGVRL